MRAVLHGDVLRVRVTRHDRKGRAEGRVLDIVERRRGPIMGRLLQEAGHWIVAPEDRRYGQDILVPKGGIGSAQSGQVVAVELTEPASLYSQPVGRVTEVLGEIDDPGMEIEIAVRKYGVPHQFSQAAAELAQKLPTRVGATDKKSRVDLTDVPLVTIDGEDARDFDDAVYCEPFTQGRGKTKVSGWRLIVAIADVSHYVKPGDALDVDAYERATSVYFPRRVIPMLPEKLSNGLCSLNPHEERLALTCDMLIDENGEITAYQFFPAVIRSHARLTYTEVADILVNTRGIQARKQEALVPHLLHLHAVYQALLKQRAKRGAVDFETTETQIICDEAGRIERIVPRVRNQAHRLIEESMLAANVCAADFIASSKHPALYRVHEGPTPEKRGVLFNYLRALGLGLTLSEEPTPGELQAVAQATRDRPDATQIHQMLLRSMQQAIYTPFQSGHFGLAYEAYTHFTSPIRRYPDLLVHRVIKAILSSKPYRFTPVGPSLTRAAKRDSKTEVRKPSSAEVAQWELAGAHTSACERRADEASRDVEAWLKCKFMRERLGEEYSGTVSSIAGFGLFVTLDELYVEGLVHITELGGEYWRFDEVRQELRGERSGMRYAVGTRVRVQVSRVDLDARKMDFRMVRDDATPLDRPVRDKRSSRQEEPSARAELTAIQQRDRDVKAQARRKKKGASASSGSRGVVQKVKAAAKRKSRR
ncbi:MAG: ribonuclease [Pseudomonadota bacterium]